MSVEIPELLTTDEFTKIKDSIPKDMGKEEISEGEKWNGSPYKNAFIKAYKKTPSDTVNLNLNSKLTADELMRVERVIEDYSINADKVSFNYVAKKFKETLVQKKGILLFAHNATGKTRISQSFKDGYGDETLCYNAYIEDMFIWDNSRNVLKIDHESDFIQAVISLDMTSKVNNLLKRYVTFTCSIDEKSFEVAFEKSVFIDGKSEYINNLKISKGEESLFIWLFFLAVVQIADDGIDGYEKIKYIYVDDPVSSLDDNNIILLGLQLIDVLKSLENVKVIISTHHTLFFNVLFNGFKKNKPPVQTWYMKQDKSTHRYMFQQTTQTPYYHHIALINEMRSVAESGDIYTYHFNILRSVLERTTAFTGEDNFKNCLERMPALAGDSDYITKVVHLLSHGGYTLYEPFNMLEDNKKIFRRVLKEYIKEYKINVEELNWEDNDE